MSLLHQPLELEILLTRDHHDLVHVRDHHPGLEQQGQIHDDELVARQSTFYRLQKYQNNNLQIGKPGIFFGGGVTMNYRNFKIRIIRFKNGILELKQDIDR